jgi:hypothetical protein
MASKIIVLFSFYKLRGVCCKEDMIILLTTHRSIGTEISCLVRRRARIYIASFGYMYMKHLDRQLF